MTSKQKAKSLVQKVLVANRGEIACRIFKTLGEMGIESVAVYSDADSSSLHTRLADYRVRLPGIQSKDTYLDADHILEIALKTGCDAIHPGYGFLSENTYFAKIVEEAGLKFIGPTSHSMHQLGDKIKAKELMRQNKIPTVPGSDGAISDFSMLKTLVDRIGYPLILKAAAGGGGRGMRVVHENSQLQSSFESCQREAQNYFGNSDVFCERYIENPRHIEFQILFDEHGNGVHLFERDCSIQRRHQKLFEEAPSTYLSQAQREHLGSLAVKAAKAAEYTGVGTIEFICESPDKAYFMEMNTRIQVEHPVTEMITGLDLVEWQVRVARGEKLAFQQQDIALHGWAMEARINAEDPTLGFLPSSGCVEKLFLPAGPFTRVDTHLYQGYAIPDAYDSMIAKVITWGQNRNACSQRMLRALKELHITGVKTTSAFHEALINHSEFAKGNFTTQFIAQNEQVLTQGLIHESPDHKHHMIAAVLAESISCAK